MSHPAKGKSGGLHASSGKLHVGRMMKRADSEVNMPDQSWCNVSGTSFDTRIGPDYATHRKKGSSKPCVYECAAIDLYSCETKVQHVGRFMDLPGDHLDDSENNGYLPATFIVNFQLPNYALENAIWGQCAGDGPGYSLVFYFVLSAYGREQVAKKGQLESAADDPESNYHGILTGENTTPRLAKHSSSHSFSSMFGVGSSSSSAQAASAASHNNHAHAAASSSHPSHHRNHYSHTDPSCFKSKTDPANASVRLLHHFVAADEGSDLRQRFKAITRMMNVDQVGLGAAPKKLVTMSDAGEDQGREETQPAFRVGADDCLFSFWSPFSFFFLSCVVPLLPGTTALPF